MHHRYVELGEGCAQWDQRAQGTSRGRPRGRECLGAPEGGIMGGIFHQAPPLPDAAMRAQRARDGVQSIQTQAVRENAQGDALASALGRRGVQRALEAEAAVLAHLACRARAHLIGLRWQWTQGGPILG
jgi:hypothetical protein